VFVRKTPVTTCKYPQNLPSKPQINFGSIFFIPSADAKVSSNSLKTSTHTHDFPCHSRIYDDLRRITFNLFLFYFCYSPSTVGDQENRDLVHTVEILVPPTVRAHPETGHVTARKGSTVTLECKASGNPVPSITWVKRVKISFVFKPNLSPGDSQVISISTGTLRRFC
jgi:hypothetical protein